MPTEFSQEMVDVAYELIEEFGTTATFTVPTSVSHDLNTGVSTKNSPSSETAKVSPPDDSFLMFTDQRKNWKSVIYLPTKNLTFTPKLEMELIIGSTKFIIMEIEEYSVSDEVVLYALWINT